jgi:hypothetical protein
VRPAGTHCDIGAYEANASPTAATLSGFNAKFNAVTQRVRVKWTTVNEMNVVGFNVWRRMNNGQWTMNNETQIPAKHPGELVGDQYRRTDKTAKSGKTYHYKLELIFANGLREWSDVKRVAVK